MSATTWCGFRERIFSLVLLAAGLLVPPLGAEEGKPTFVTNVYQVPVDFLSSGPDGIDFKSPIEMLTSVAGVHFQTGASAMLNGANHQLIVRNTPEQLELVEAYVESLNADSQLQLQLQLQVQVHVTAIFVTATQRLFGPDDGAAEPEVSGEENATFVADDQSVVVELLKQTGLEGAVTRAEGKTIERVSWIKPGARPLVLNSRKFAALMEKLRDRDQFQATIVGGSGGFLQSGQGSLLIQGGKRGIGVGSATIGADYGSLDLGLYTQGPRIEGRSERRLSSLSVTVDDNSTVALERQLQNGLYEYDFITARIVDAAGQPIKESDQSAAGKKAAAGEVSAPGNELCTNVYRVPPTFASAGDGGATDPFAPAPQKTAKSRPEARQILENAGITFGEGASAIYQAAGSKLIVRNTLDQMELVEAYLESIKSSAEKLIHVKALFVETDKRLFDGPLIGVADEGRKKGGDKTARVRVASQREMALLLAEKDVASAVQKRRQTEAKQRAEPGAIMNAGQFKTALKLWRKSEAWTEVDGGDCVLRPGQGATVLAAGERGIGVINAVIGADDIALDLQLMVQGAVPQRGPRPVATTEVTPWSGHTMVFGRKLPNGRYQYDFLTVEIIGADGKPAKPKSVEEKQAATQQSHADTEMTNRDIEAVKRADKLALQGNRMLADEQYAQARDFFLQSLEILPSDPLTKDRETAYLTQFMAALRASARQEN